MADWLILGCGYVGGRLARALLASGQRVRVCARNTQRLEPLAATGAQVHALDAAKLPADLAKKQFEAITAQAKELAELGQKDEVEWQFNVGVRWAARQVQELIDAGIPGLHFYVLNKSPATAAVLNQVRRP